MGHARTLVHLAGTILSVLLLVSCSESESPDRLPTMTASIAVMPHSFTSYTVFLAQEKGFFHEEGVDVGLVSFPHGKATLAALTEEKVDFSMSSETPFIRKVMSGAEISTLAVTTRAHRHLAVVARRDKGIETIADMQGKKVGVTKGSNGEYFLDVVLALHGMSRDELELLHVIPGQMVTALEAGKVDAIATWNPQMHDAKGRLGTNGVTFDAGDLYSPYFLLLSRKDYIAANRETVERVLRALQKASLFIRSSPETAHAIVASRLKTDVESLRQLTAEYDFELSLDQALLTILENQTEWIRARDQSPKGDPPAYLDHIDANPLEAVSPSAVGIIQ